MGCGSSYGVLELAVVCPLLSELGELVVPGKIGDAVLRAVGIVRIDNGFLEVAVVDARSSEDVGGSERHEGLGESRKMHSDDDDDANADDGV